MGSGASSAASSVWDGVKSVGKTISKGLTKMGANMIDSTFINPALTDFSGGIIPPLNIASKGADALSSLYHTGGRVHAKLKNGAYVVSHPVHTHGKHVVLSSKHKLHKHIKKIYK
jgi:hypothetical protein